MFCISGNVISFNNNLDVRNPIGMNEEVSLFFSIIVASRFKKKKYVYYTRYNTGTTSGIEIERAIFEIDFSVGIGGGKWLR